MEYTRNRDLFLCPTEDDNVRRDPVKQDIFLCKVCPAVSNTGKRFQLMDRQKQKTFKLICGTGAETV